MIYSPLAPGKLINLSEHLRRHWQARRIAEVSPDDTADLPFLPRLVYCVSSGHVKLRLQDGSEKTISMIEGANQVPAETVRILATGTTAVVVAIAD